MVDQRFSNIATHTQLPVHHNTNASLITMNWPASIPLQVIQKFSKITTCLPTTPTNQQENLKNTIPLAKYEVLKQFDHTYKYCGHTY